MSTPIYLEKKDHFLCSMCQCGFTDPVNKPCGHNFCKTCIDKFWKMNIPHQCPVCKTVFNTTPEQKVGSFSSEVTAGFKQSAQQKASSKSSEQHVSKPGEVPCDVCTGTKLKAQKSCLVCLASYCETHLEPHLTASRLQRHQLIEPVGNLDDRMCKKHGKLLELFCKNDQTCVCMMCTVLDHKMHDFVSLEEAFEEKKAGLGTTEAEIQHVISARSARILQTKMLESHSRDLAFRKTTEGVCLFNTLKESVERSRNIFVNAISEEQRKTEKQVEGVIKELEQELSELKGSSAELKHLSQSGDHLRFLQKFSSLKTSPPTKDWTKVNIQTPEHEETLRRAVNELVETLSEFTIKAALRMVQQFAVDVTLDPKTAHISLIVLNNEKQVMNNNTQMNSTFRVISFMSFWACPCVLAKQSFSSGRFYYEVQVKGKTNWDLGVARESINKTGQIELSPKNGYWTLILRNVNEYEAAADPPVVLSLKSGPEKVGVFVDYEEGEVSFFDVDAESLIYSFSGCSFTERLFPFFSPGVNLAGENSAPLIISPVK